MPPRNTDLHGNAPDTSRVALVLVDVINDLEFEGGDRLLPQALAMAERLAVLAARARRARVLVIYVNDNFGRAPSCWPASPATAACCSARAMPSYATCGSGFPPTAWPRSSHSATGTRSTRWRVCSRPTSRSRRG